MPDVGSNKVQLGCGTLIIIALIVMFLSGGNQVDDLKKNVQESTKQVIVLQDKVDRLTKEVESLQRAELESRQ